MTDTVYHRRMMNRIALLLGLGCALALTWILWTAALNDWRTVWLLNEYHEGLAELVGLHVIVAVLLYALWRAR